MKPTFALVLVYLLVASHLAWGDKWAPPKPRVFGSRWGGHAFKLMPSRMGGASEGTLFRLDAEGKEQIVWQAKLVNTPHQVIVDEGGKYLITIDTYGSVGYAHALVIYGDLGKVIADFKLEDLLSKEEIAGKTYQTESSRTWALKSNYAIEEEVLVLRLEWGKTIRVDLASGKIKGTQ